MAITNRIASCLNDALDLTPAQILTLCDATARLRLPDRRGGMRYGSKEDFKAMIFGFRGA